jgi:hypothetical protein
MIELHADAESIAEGSSVLYACVFLSCNTLFYEDNGLCVNEFSLE